MLTEICASIRNYFTDDQNKYIGNFKISGGVLAPSDFLKEGQYFRIIGSIFNDGVHQFPASDLMDEDFFGAVWAMKVPPDFLNLAEEIKSYQNSDAAKPSQFSSESFAGYSYTKATDKDGAPLSWQSVFKNRLNNWRRI